MGLFDSVRKRLHAEPEKEKFVLERGEFVLPVQVIRETRPNSRVAMGKSGAIMRISLLLPRDQQLEQIGKFRVWLEGQLTKHPDKYERFRQKVYHHGEVLSVGGRDYTLRFVREADKANVTGKLHTTDHTIVFHVPAQATDRQLGPAIETLLSRLIGAHFLPEVTRRVHELNAQHFGKKINKISLKYNHSNWGSCSSKGNINLSTRLLLAPPKVLDYVIIHELAHLLEMNHSHRFWAHVERAMPDYRDCEKWLNKHGGGMNY